MDYPVLEIIPGLKKYLQSRSIVILQAPPGAGKSTIVPLQLLNEPWLEGKKIILLEPRRLAARSVAQRMASLLKEEAGETIGYRIRFENKISPKTRIEVVTEGILTRMLQTDNGLTDVGLVIFDEFHERSLQADLALALCYQCQQILRDDLRMLIMSATLDGEKISNTFDQAPIVTSMGRQFPVTVVYLAIDKNEKLSISCARVIKKALREQEGDVLVFLPGVMEIQRVQELLEQEITAAEIYPLYGDLPFQRQQQAIMPHPQGKRKIVLATSIAETSLTIEGVTVVIDSGFARVPRFDPRSGLTRLETIPVTRDSADQRAGRAGRLKPGVCYRLWAEASHQHLLATRAPEIMEADLSSLILELAQWGVTEPTTLKWLTPPPVGTVGQAKDLLLELGAIEDGRITNRGKEMAKLPTHPRLAHMLILANDHDLIALATDVAAILEERDPLAKEASADLTLRVEALRRWRSGERAEGNGYDRLERLASSWRKLFKVPVDNKAPSEKSIGRILSEAYPDRLARQIEKHGARYKMISGRVVKLQEHDPLIRNSWLSIAQVDAGKNEGKIFLAAALDEGDLEHLAIEREKVEWDADKGMIIAQREKSIGALTLSSKSVGRVSDEVRIPILCEAVRKEGLKLLGWSDLQDEWQARMLSLKMWRPQEVWPDVSDEGLLKTCDEWLAPFLTPVSKRIDFQRLDLHAILTTILPWELQFKADKLAPVKLEVPSGSHIKIQYSKNGDAPVIQVRLQEVFGLLETPAINEGKTKLLLHLLSPGYKPVQVTQDLKSFWQTTYHEVRKELRPRYPKHHWPEDPWTAEAVRGVKRRS